MNNLSMMGNQRQVLKDNIEKELVTKIEAAKDVITQLNKNLEISKQNSLSVKDEIGATTNVMKEVLVERKKDLLKEVDNLHSVQARSLQDAMRSTYITMGKLQNMLTNLESFDQSQLVRLQIPQVSMTYTTSEPVQISVTIDCNQLKEDLSEWGSVTTDGFHCMSDKPSVTVPIVPSVSRKCTPVIEAQNIRSPCSNKENVKGSAKEITVCASCPWSNWGIENWLSGTKSRKMSADTSTTSTKDEFLIIPSPCSESSDMDFVVPSLELNIPNQMDAEAHDDGKSGSSIVCVEKDTVSDLSEWLKPRKIAKATPLTAHKYNEAVLLSDASSFLSSKKRSVSKTEKRILDFPCLRIESENWVQKKKAKSLSDSSTNSKSYRFDEQKLIPPTHALPNPFWLKKYQNKR